MIEAEDTLPDWAWTEEELTQMAKDNLVFPKYYEEPTHIVFYHLYKDGIKTGLVLITIAKSIIDTQNAIDRFWKEADITCIVGEYNEESVLNQEKCEALYRVLDKFRYKGKMQLLGSDKVYKYESWMGNLI